MYPTDEGVCLIIVLQINIMIICYIHKLILQFGMSFVERCLVIQISEIAMSVLSHFRISNDGKGAARTVTHAIKAPSHGGGFQHQLESPHLPRDTAEGVLEHVSTDITRSILTQRVLHVLTDLQQSTSSMPRLYPNMYQTACICRYTLG